MLIARRTRSFVLVAGVLSGVCRLLAQTPNAVTCSQATLTKPEVGRAFRGVVTNDDYEFSATVPEGYTGWDGVAANAPFHGFTIFLDKSLQSCILFEVHIRVDDTDAPLHLHATKALSLGQARAWQTSGSLTAKGAKIVNLKTSFTFDHNGEIEDGQVTLISPAAEKQSTTRLYDKFLKSIHFGGH